MISSDIGVNISGDNELVLKFYLYCYVGDSCSFSFSTSFCFFSFFPLFQKASIILQVSLLKVILLHIYWRINLINLQLWEYFNFAFRLYLKMMFSFYFLYILCLY